MKIPVKTDRRPSVHFWIGRQAGTVMLIILSVKIAVLLVQVFFGVLLWHPVLFFRAKGDFLEVANWQLLLAVERAGMISGGNGSLG